MHMTLTRPVVTLTRSVLTFGGRGKAQQYFSLLLLSNECLILVAEILWISTKNKCITEISGTYRALNAMSYSCSKEKENSPPLYLAIN